MSVRQDERETLEANRAVHAYLVTRGEYQRSPHFRPENIARVDAVIERLHQRLAGQRSLRAVDFGCGTGFMIDRIWNHFDEVHGVDITPEMMSHVDLRGGKVRLHECRAEATPLASGSCDFASAYSFMDHLHDVEPFLAEAARLLRPGGIFYADLNPNRAFIEGMKAAHRWLRPLSPLVEREITGALNNGAMYESSTGLDARTLERAEPGKSIRWGFDSLEIQEQARRAGFAATEVEPHWFLGEAGYLHGPNPSDASLIDSYLRSIHPAGDALFKYLRLIFVR